MNIHVNEIYPRLISLPQFGDYTMGTLVPAESGVHIPFFIKRVFWIYNTHDGLERGSHAHKQIHQMVFAMHGTIHFEVEDKERTTYQFILDNPAKGLYLPPKTWSSFRFSEGAVLMCLASDIYDENEYLRNYEDFISA
jgi:dTDP-4-dehydrorhamnose 3,5-epimerase-like enzyme